MDYTDSITQRTEALAKLSPFVRRHSHLFVNQQVEESKVQLSTEQKDFWDHRAEVRDDGRQTVTFKWHWPRGTFDRRMSALEIAKFILPHMPHILPLLGDWPDVQREFAVLLSRLVIWPVQVLDEVVPWIRRLDFSEEDEILLLDLGAREVPHAPVFSLPG